MKKQNTHGGRRKGAGRPKTLDRPHKVYSFRLPVDDMARIEGNKVAFVRAAIAEQLKTDYSRTERFWLRLKDFVSKVQVHDPMSEEEQEMIIDVCNERLNKNTLK